MLHALKQLPISLDRFGQAVHLSTAMLDGSDHQVLNVRGRDAAYRNRGAIAAVEREYDMYLPTIVAGDLQPVGVSAGTVQIQGQAADTTSLLAAFVVPLQEQPVHLHDAVDAFWITRVAPGLLGLPAQQSLNAAIALGSQIGDGPADIGDPLGIR